LHASCDDAEIVGSRLGRAEGGVIVSATSIRVRFREVDLKSRSIAAAAPFLRVQRTDDTRQ
jgi:hypothetical protein